MHRSELPRIGQSLRELLESSLSDIVCILTVCCVVFFEVIYLCMNRSIIQCDLFRAADLYFAFQQAHLINFVVQDSFFPIW